MTLNISVDFMKNLIRQMVQVSRSGFGLSENSLHLGRSFKEQEKQAFSVQRENGDTHKEAQIILQETDSLHIKAGAANEVSRNGREKQQAYLEEMEVLADSIRKGTDFLDEFRKSAEDISRLSQMILDISSRLDVLSINGAIEAARRGEAGLGFSVITREMKNLSQETSASAERVGRIIKQFDNASSDLQDLFQGSQTSLHNSKEDAAAIYKTFLNIEDQNREMADQVKNIRSLIESLVESNENRKVSADKILNSIQNSSQQIEQISRESTDLHSVVKNTLENIGGIRLDWHDRALGAVREIASRLETGNRSLDSVLKEQFVSYPFIELLYVLDHKGIQVADNCIHPDFTDQIANGGRGEDRSGKSYFSQVQDEKDHYISDLYISTAVNHLCLTISVPFQHLGNRYVLAADMNLEAFVHQE